MQVVSDRTSESLETTTLADTWPEKIGKRRLVVSLNFEPETREERCNSVKYSDGWRNIADALSRNALGSLRVIFADCG